MKPTYKHYAGWFAAAWMISTTSVMFTSALLFEMPSLQDFIGFGGVLFFAALLLVPVFYQPVLYMARKIRQQILPSVKAALLVCIGNLPLYILTYRLSSGNTSASEVKLFFTGYIVLAIVYGLMHRYVVEDKSSRTEMQTAG